MLWIILLPTQYSSSISYSNTHTAFMHPIGTKCLYKMSNYMHVYIFSQVPIAYGQCFVRQCVINGKSHIRVIRLYNYTNIASDLCVCMYMHTHVYLFMYDN